MWRQAKQKMQEKGKREGRGALSSFFACTTSFERVFRELSRCLPMATSEVAQQTFFSVLRKTPLIAQPPCSGWLKFLLQWPWTRPPLTAALCGEHVGQKTQHGVPALRQGWKQMLQGQRRIESSGRCHWIHLPTSERFQLPAFVLYGEEGKAWMVGGRGRGERHVMRNSRDLHSDLPRCHREKKQKNSLKFRSGVVRRSVLHKTLFSCYFRNDLVSSIWASCA